MDFFSNNIADLLVHQAERQGRSAAVYFPEGRDSFGRVSYTHLTFQQLNELSDYYAWGLHNIGVKAKHKTLLMIRPSLEFYALFFALFKLGAIPVLIDPGMGWKNFLETVQEMAPDVFLGIPAAQLLRLFKRKSFSSVKINITLGKFRLWSGWTINELPGKHLPFASYQPEPDDLAAIMFTSGSTGPAKGVSYTQAMFNAQVALIKREYNIKPGELDLACFPLFSLFSIALGAGIIIPDMDPSKPAEVKPKHIIEALQNFPVTYSFASPALWGKMAEYASKRKLRFPGLKKVIMAGAPVPAIVHERLLKEILDQDAETYTPYGATESLPIANFTGSEMLAETKDNTAAGKGTCVGKPIAEIEAKIISISDELIADMSEAQELAVGEIGELCVSGPCVSKEYYNKAEATALAKIYDGEKVWHRVGDTGYFDEKGRFWFCGRKSHRVIIKSKGKEKTLFSLPSEAVFNQLPGVKRSALIGIERDGEVVAAIVIEKEKDSKISEKEIMKVAAENELTAEIKMVFFCDKFPVDVRHNAKINREQLTEVYD